MTDVPRLIFLLNSLEIGGSETKIVRVANALAQSGRQVALAYLDERADLLTHVDPLVQVTCLQRRGKYSIAALWRLWRLVGSKPCIVVAINSYPLLYALPAAKLLPPGSSKVVATINTSLVGDVERRRAKFYAPFMRQCDLLVFGCHSEMCSWTRRLALPVEKSTFIHNGVDQDHFAPNLAEQSGPSLREAHGIPRDAIALGCVSRLARNKGLEDAISALAGLRTAGHNCYLAMVGKGPEKDHLAEWAQELGVADQVVFLGLMHDVRPALSMADIFLLPSIAVETFSNAALEAMAMAKPVVLSDIGGAREMIEHGKSGMLFRAGDVTELTKTLGTLVSSKAARKALGSEARKRVETLFSFPQMVEQYEKLYRI